MLSLNDFKEKQIIFVQNSRDDETKIKFNNDNIIYLKDDKIINQLSLYKILAIFIIGDNSFTSVFIRKAVEFGISIFLMKPNFETYASIESKAEGNYLLRDKQYHTSNEFYISQSLVKNKLWNQLALIKKDRGR